MAIFMKVQTKSGPLPGDCKLQNRTGWFDVQSAQKMRDSLSDDWSFRSISIELAVTPSALKFLPLVTNGEQLDWLVVEFELSQTSIHHWLLEGVNVPSMAQIGGPPEGIALDFVASNYTGARNGRWPRAKVPGAG